MLVPPGEGLEGGSRVTEKQILERVEASEYRKELARLLAEGLIDESDLEEIRDDPEAWILAFLAALVASLRAPSSEAAEDAAGTAGDAGLEQPDPETRAAIRAEAEREFIEQAGAALLAALLPLRDVLIRAEREGVEPETMAAALGGTTGTGLLGSVRSAAKRQAVSLIQATERAVLRQALEQTSRPSSSAATPDPVYTWITLQDDNVCEGFVEEACRHRHGQQRTLERWRAIGLPGAPNLRCSSRQPNCRCMLEFSSESPSVPEPVEVGEAIKAGKARAAREARG